MAFTGLGYPATRPALARLAHIRAVLAARLWLASTAAWTDGKAWWHSGRRVRGGQATVSVETTDATLKASPPSSTPAKTDSTTPSQRTPHQ